MYIISRCWATEPSISGASDLNALMGRSKFTSPTELLISKLPKEKREELELEHEEFHGNIWTEVGNVFETKIQECLGLVGDQESYSMDFDGFKFTCHIDGRSNEEEWQLHEIKVTGNKHQKGGRYVEMTNEEYIDKLLYEYNYQLQGQMLLTDKMSNVLTALPRRGLMAEKVRDILEEFNLPNLHDLDCPDFAEEVFARVREAFEDYLVNKEDVVMLEVVRSENAIKEIEVKMKILIKYINLLKECDCMFKAIDIISKFEKEIQGGDDVALEISSLSNKVLELEKQLVLAKQIEKESKAEKKKLEAFFTENGLSKYETPNGIKISLGKNKIETIDKPTSLLTKEFVEGLLELAQKLSCSGYPVGEELEPFLNSLDSIGIEDLFETKEKVTKGMFKVTIPKALLIEKKESKTELPV